MALAVIRSEAKLRSLRCVLSFSNGDGVGLTANNQVSGITIIAMSNARAIYTQAGISDMGTIALSDLAVTGHGRRLHRLWRPRLTR